MSSRSFNQQMSSEDLHIAALGFNSVTEANTILKHPNCSLETNQMVIAKLRLFDNLNLGDIPEDCHLDIIGLIQQKADGPVDTTG